MTHLHFIANSKKFFIFSGALIVIVLVATFIVGVPMDIQFKGGSIVTYEYDGTLDQQHFEETAQELTQAQISMQLSQDIATGNETAIITMPGDQSLNADEMLKLTEGLKAEFPENNPRTISINNVDPTIGKDFLTKCLVAVGLASVLMMIYVAFRFRKIGGVSAGAMAVVALIHDIIIVFGVFVIFQIPINDNFIAVVLTILGYSLNDTIVIYDRIRENRRLMGPKTGVAELVDTSINQSFRRSLNTSVTTVLAMTVVTVVAYLYNVNSILTFSFPLIIGLIFGAYSSICVAGPLWVKWQERKLETK